MGNYSEFDAGIQRAKQHIDFNQDRNVSVFETNIRMVGGLLSAHFFAEHRSQQARCVADHFC